MQRTSDFEKRLQENMVDMQRTSNHAKEKLTCLRDMLDRTLAMMNQTRMALSEKEEEIRKKAMEVAELQKTLQNSAKQGHSRSLT